MEKSEVSLQEVKFFRTLHKHASEWTTSKELAVDAGIAERTARAYVLKLSKLGLLDTAEVFPAHRYRLSEKAGKRNFSYVNRLRDAAAVFGVALEG